MQFRNQQLTEDDLMHWMEGKQKKRHSSSSSSSSFSSSSSYCSYEKEKDCYRNHFGGDLNSAANGGNNENTNNANNSNSHHHNVDQLKSYIVKKYRRMTARKMLPVPKTNKVRRVGRRGRRRSTENDNENEDCYVTNKLDIDSVELRIDKHSNKSSKDDDYDERSEEIEDIIDCEEDNGKAATTTIGEHEGNADEKSSINSNEEEEAKVVSPNGGKDDDDAVTVSTAVVTSSSSSSSSCCEQSSSSLSSRISSSSSIISSSVAPILKKELAAVSSSKSNERRRSKNVGVGGMKRSVSFSKVEDRVAHILSIDEMTSDEIFNTWLTIDEKIAIRKSVKRIVDTVEDRGTDYIHGRKLCTRGLESYFSRYDQIREFYQFTREEVLYEQDEQISRHGYLHDPYAVASAYKSSGIIHESKRLAEMKAIKDREDVQKYLYKEQQQKQQQQQQ